MTKTQYYTATSIDGFIADAHNSLEWLFQVEARADNEPHEAQFAAFFAEVGAMAMGSTTYEWILEHDSLLTDPQKWHTYYGDTPCWVFTHRDLPLIPGADVRFVRDDVTGPHDDMVRAADGKNVWIVGGGELVGQFADAGRLNEIRLGVAPVMLGAGAPLLPRTLTGVLRLTAVEHDSAFVHLTYAVQQR